jgi:hypothetical protein
MRRNSHRKGWMSRLRRGAFGFAALLAIALQAFAVQAHVHAFGVGHAASVFARSANDAAAHVSVSGEAQRACAICQARASSGRMLLPADASIARAESVAIQQPALVIPFVAVSFSHSWRSRAPPTAL